MMQHTEYFVQQMQNLGSFFCALLLSSDMHFLQHERCSGANGSGTTIAHSWINIIYWGSEFILAGSGYK